MHLSLVGMNKRCFLASFALCAIVLLLIPTLQTPQRRGELPRPLPHTRSAKGENATNYNSDRSSVTELTLPSDKSNRDSGSMGVLISQSKEPLGLKDIFIAVKTTRKYHRSRLELLFQTWVSEARKQTFIFTDGDDKELKQKAGDNVINTNCSAAHTRQALCCKMSVEWFCHVDDDNYVILPSLLQLLSSYSHTQDVYLGRPSLDHPIEAPEIVKSDGRSRPGTQDEPMGKVFEYITHLKISPHLITLGNFITTAEKIRLPDDCTVGYIIEALLDVPLIHTELFHSHLENLQRMPAADVLKQVTISYSSFENRRNVIPIAGKFSLTKDPSRFSSSERLNLNGTRLAVCRSSPGSPLSGIGRATALALARGGAEVIAVTRTQADLDTLVHECASIKPVCVDLADWNATENALKDVGPVDLLVNNAGCATLEPFLEITQDSFDTSFSVNVKAALHVAQIVAKGMKARGSGGSIVNISSQASHRAFKDHAVYCATKGALDMMTKVMALELAPYQIRVNSVNPTVVLTDMAKIGWSDPVKANSMISRIPMGKFAEVEDVVHAILFLLCDKSSMTNGVFLPIDGGFLIA
ncbi:Beta-1,3-N-acetylglucosaminyltransferase radical fringe [Bagarius yarrelli]|uniref:Beta-1,3-N-acetylglucosaminyltransferase radical fringe n=1 Tax=Bagarius yarrelli TaxID=175774 RepID=A0A556TID8_BAGYA|nr:Beta-1,3-N-acetylglucosaminyltransferase radical fringe [Bagarius yarrelli]